MNAFVNHKNLALSYQYDQLQTKYESEFRVVWSFMSPIGRPCFNPTLLTNIMEFENSLMQLKGQYLINGALEKINYVVFASDVPGVFNLGGDLQVFHDKILQGDRETLQYYSDLCIGNIWNRLNHFGANVTTISLIEGQALGGGFEAALTADIIVAERSAKMGLPEIIFNLFPGMGALSLLTRKIGLKKAEEIVLSGRLYSAEELLALGVIDILAEDGQGKQQVQEWIAGNSKRRNGYMAVQRSKQLINAITYDELKGIGDIWVDAALTLEARDLRMMNRLIQAQSKMCEA
jgi:DSF synthase